MKSNLCLGAMRRQCVCRRLSVGIFTLSVLLFVDFQLRTSAPPTPAPGPGVLLRRTAGGSGGISWGPAAAAGGRTRLELRDIFIAVKTTGRFHRTRLELLLHTWIPRTKEHTFIFTDLDDKALSSDGYNMVVTACESDHSQQALSCKMSAEYDSFMASNMRWFCHVDDDNYVNPDALLSLLAAFPQDGDVYVGKPSLDRPITAHELLEGNTTREVQFWFATGGAGFCLSRRLAEKMSPWASGSQFEKTSATIRLPDDCTVGFIVEKRLGISMVHCPLFHSHLENLLLISQRSIRHQVTLSYGIFENKLNSIELKGRFSKEDDPSRFKSVHCLLYPFTSWCP